MPDENDPRPFFGRLSYKVLNLFEGPATFIRVVVLECWTTQAGIFHSNRFPLVIFGSQHGCLVDIQNVELLDCICGTKIFDLNTLLLTHPDRLLLIDGVVFNVRSPTEKIVLPNRGPEYPWYHRKFPRVPEIDQCYMDDMACIYEAEQQFTRDKRVEVNLVRILQKRRDDCVYREQPDHLTRCAKVFQDFNDAELNLFIKYGDMGIKQSAQMAFMKQKHRLVVERRKRENYVPNPPKFIDKEQYFYGYHK